MNLSPAEKDLVRESADPSIPLLHKALLFISVPCWLTASVVVGWLYADSLLLTSALVMFVARSAMESYRNLSLILSQKRILNKFASHIKKLESEIA
jgi:hypothetical protein